MNENHTSKSNLVINLGNRY